MGRASSNLRGQCLSARMCRCISLTLRHKFLNPAMGPDCKHRETKDWYPLLAAPGTSNKQPIYSISNPDSKRSRRTTHHCCWSRSPNPLPRHCMDCPTKLLWFKWVLIPKEEKSWRQEFRRRGRYVLRKLSVLLPSEYGEKCTLANKLIILVFKGGSWCPTP